MKYFRLNILIFGLVFLFTACAKKPEVEKPIKLNSRSSKYLIDKIDNNNKSFDSFFAKFTANTLVNNKSVNFKGSIRIRKDSIIWLSLTKLGGVELVRMTITKDSLKFINKWDKQYYIGGLSDLKDFGGIDADFNTIQDLFIGQPIDFNKDQKYKSSNDNQYYLLSSKAKSKIRKATQVTENDSMLTFGTKEKAYEKIIAKEDEGDLVLKNYYLIPESFLLSKQSISLIAQKQAIEVVYSDYELFDDEVFFALRHVIRIASKENSSRFDIKYTTLKFNNQLSFPFKISKKYAPIEKK